MSDKNKSPEFYDAPARRRHAREVPLRGTDALELRALREKIKRGSGERRYVYRTSERAPRITIANYEVPGRTDLVGVYDRRVTTAMLRQDLYGEDPHDIKWAEWGERSAA